jgi:hypothetical protein
MTGSDTLVSAVKTHGVSGEDPQIATSLVDRLVPRSGLGLLRAVTAIPGFSHEDTIMKDQVTKISCVTSSEEEDVGPEEKSTPMNPSRRRKDMSEMEQDDFLNDLERLAGDETAEERIARDARNAAILAENRLCYEELVSVDVEPREVAGVILDHLCTIDDNDYQMTGPSDLQQTLTRQRARWGRNLRRWRQTRLAGEPKYLFKLHAEEATNRGGGA